MPYYLPATGFPFFGEVAEDAAPRFTMLMPRFCQACRGGEEHEMV